MATKSKKEINKRRAEMRNAPEEDPEFQIAPMIDILLVLLVFFMSISSTEVLQVNQAIKLPVAKDAKAPKDNQGQVIVNVLWNPINNIGTLDINEIKYSTPADLVPVLSDALVRNPQTRVLIRADKHVKYAFMRQILKAIGDAQITSITFSVIDKEMPPGS